MIRKGLLAFTLLVSTSAFAVEANTDAKGWVGGLFGVQVPSYDDVDSRTAWGITAGAKLGSEYGLGAYYLNADGDGLGGSVDYNLMGIELTYQFEGEAAGVYLGGRMGLTKLKTQIGSVTNDFNPYHWGLLAGYNHFLSPNISIGGEGSIFFVPKDTDNSGTPGSSKAFEIISLLASLKFWF